MPPRCSLILLLPAIAAVRVAADDTLYRYEADVSPCDPSTGWICGNPCEPPCSDSVEDGHYVLRFAEGGDIFGYALLIAPTPGEPPPSPPTLWVEWRYKSNHALGPNIFSCDARIASAVAESLPPKVAEKAKSVEGVTNATVDLVWDPPWTPDSMSEAAKLQLNM